MRLLLQLAQRLTAAPFVLVSYVDFVDVLLIVVEPEAAVCAAAFEDEAAGLTAAKKLQQLRDYRGSKQLQRIGV